MSKNLKNVVKALKKAGFGGVSAQEWRKSIVLSGQVKTWEDKIKAGYAAARKGYKGVVNDIEVPGSVTDAMSVPQVRDKALEGRHFDVVVIGGGVTGCAIIRELARFDLKVALLEKEEDVARHASSRNDGMIHDGFAASPGTKKAHYNVRGNAAYTQVCKELGVDFKRPGSMILFGHPLYRLAVPILIARARKNGLSEYRFVSQTQVNAMVPNVVPKHFGGFFLPSAGILSPFKLTIAFAENAVTNGAQVFFHTVVSGFDREHGKIIKIKTNRGDLSAGIVVNAAGIWSDKIAAHADDRFFSLHGRKGVDAILDLKTGQYQPIIMAMPPLVGGNKHTKGGGLITTPEGNLLVGPNAYETPFREEYSTRPEDIEQIMVHLHLNTKLSKADIITYFAGIRACTYEEDFVIEASETVENLVHVAGIQSPGLASAPAIAEDVAGIVTGLLKKKMDVKRNERFNPVRKANPELKGLDLKTRAELIRKNPAYGRIVCRCEEISEGEVIDALHSPVPATTLDGLKRRARVGAGRCQGGFCTPRVLEIMSKEMDVSMLEIKKKGENSEILLEETKGHVDYSNKKIKKTA
ncbi:MAG: FAD-dependent oxidoreductase [Thermodesulfobacteriota bacterium]